MRFVAVWIDWSGSWGSAEQSTPTDNGPAATCCRAEQGAFSLQFSGDANAATLQKNSSLHAFPDSLNHRQNLPHGGRIGTNCRSDWLRMARELLFVRRWFSGRVEPHLLYVLQETDRMSRYCLKTAAAIVLGICGCHPGMFQPYGPGMYGPPSGTLVVPPATNAPTYPLDSGKTYDDKDAQDDFRRDPKFYNSDPATENVPAPKDAGSSTMFPAEGQ